MVGQGWLIRALRRAATAAIRGEFPRELASSQSSQPAHPCCSTPVSNSHSQEPLAWTVVHRARGPWGTMARRRVDRAVMTLSHVAEQAAFGLPQRFLQLAGDSLRPLCSRLDESKFDASWEIFWKLCVISLTRCKCGTSMKCVEELRALIQSERNWIMPPGNSSPRRSAQVLQWLTHGLSLLCWLEETVCWSGRGRRLRAKFLSRARFLPCSITRGIANGSLSHETFDAVAAWLGDQCLDSLVRHDADSTLTYLLTAGCATYVGITGQRDGGKGLGGAQLASWNTSVTFEGMRDIMRDVVLVSVGIKNVPLVKVMTVISKCSASTVDRLLLLQPLNGC